jgi:dihydrofolate reductase
MIADEGGNMRNVILQEFVSVDGMAAAQKDSVDFIPAAMTGDQSFGRRQIGFLDTIDMILLGRRTYEMFVEYWPNVTSGDEQPFADKLNAIPKVVFSRSLDRAPWGKWAEATVVATDARKEIERLKQQPGKDMVIWGSISLAQALMREGLIDEYQLVVCPVVLGEGRRLFDEHATPGEMHLLSTRSFDRGAVLLSYSGALVAAGH